MKAMILVLSPEECVNLLNGDLSILVRKKFSKDFVGWVYIYCTKGKSIFKSFGSPARSVYTTLKMGTTFYDMEANGKVISKFWCDKVGEIYCGASSLESKRTVDWVCNGIFSFEKVACLTQEDLDKYLGNVKHSPQGYAIHITKLEIFDKPKEISEFKHLVKYTCKTCPYNHEDMDGDICSKCCETKPLTRAPSNYCYVEAK